MMEALCQANIPQIIIKTLPAHYQRNRRDFGLYA